MKLPRRLKQPRHFLRYPILTVGLCAAFLPVAHYAATFLWDGGGGDNNISTAANWNPNTAPTAAATDNILQFAGTTRLGPVQDFSSLRVQSLQFNSGAGAFTISGNQINLQTGAASPTIVQNSNSDQIISAPLLLTNNVTLSGTGTGQLSLNGSVSGAGGLTKSSSGNLVFNGAASIPSITVSAGSVIFAAGSSSLAARIDVSAGGDFTLNGGTVNTGAGSFFQIGNSSGTATASLNSGSLTSSESDLGNVFGATGTVTQSGGTHTVSGQLYLGVVAGSTGNYTLSGTGTLSTSSTQVGYRGTGVFTQNGGNHNVTGALQLGGQNAGNGTYHLNGGTLTVGSINNNTNAGGTSLFNFNGGTLRPNANTTTFLESLNQAVVRTGGALIDTNSFNITIAQPLLHEAALGAAQDGGLRKLGVGTLTLTGVSTYTGSTIVSGGTLTIGSGGKVQNSFLQVAAGGTFQLVAGGAYDAGTAAYINVGGIAGTGPATVLQTGGTLNSSATDIGNLFGVTAVFTQSGGTHTATDVVSQGLAAGANGTYNLKGTGVLNSSGPMYVGVNGTGTFNQTGGTVNVARVEVALSAGAGTYLLSAGQVNLTTNFLVATNGTGTLVQSGGTLAVPGTLSIGQNSVATGTYEMSGGTTTVGSSFFVGNAGNGILQQTGGLINVATQFVVANQASAVGAYRLAGGTLRASVVRGGSGDATFSFDGGKLQLSATPAAFLTAFDMLQMLQGGGQIDTNGFDATLSAPVAHDVSDSGGLGRDGGLTKLGAGTLTLTGTNTFNGGVKILGGTVSVGLEANLGAASGPITIADGATLAFTASPFVTSRTFTLSNAALKPASNGTLTYVNSTVNGGYLSANGTSSLHNLNDGAKFNYTTVLPGTSVTHTLGTATMTGVTISGNLTQSSGATLNYNGGYITPSATVTVGGTVNATGVEITGRVAVSGTLNFSGTLGYGAVATISSTGKIAAPASTSIELNGARLENNGDQDGILNINRDSVVVGSGTFGSVTVKAGGTFSPGNSPGTTSLESFTLADGGAYQFELNSTAINPGVNQDFLSVSGTLAITASAANPFILRLTSLAPNNGAGPVSNFFTNVPYTFTLASATNITGFSADKFAIDTSAFLNPLDGGNFTITRSGDFTKLFLNFTPIPEPATLSLLALAAPLLVRRRRAKKTG